jgi:uncharacterized coiled-coil protein SlyX
LTETPLQFTNSQEAKRWLETQTSTTLTPVRNQAKQLRDEMNFAAQGISEVSKQLFDTSSKEIEKRNMKVYNRARALNKLARLFIDRFKKLTPPDDIAYDQLSKYAIATQKTLMVTDIDVKNWFPRISPFFIMDRRRFLTVYEKAKQTYSSLNDFITKEYVKTKTLQETFQLLGEVQNIEKQLSNLNEDKEQIRNERLPIEQEIAELETKIAELQSCGPIDKLNLVNAEIEALSNELKNDMRHLQKPFIKMQALATSGGGGGITPDELSKINQYLDAPFEALVSEQPSYPVLREILEKLQGLLAQDKLKLKPDKARKAEQTIKEILFGNSLLQLQTRCMEMANTKNHLTESSKMDEIKAHLAQYQEQVEQLKARKTSVETHETVKANTYNEIADRLTSLKRAIEKNVADSLNIKIQFT